MGKNSVVAVVVPRASWAVGILKSANLYSGPKPAATAEFAEAFSQAASKPQAVDAIKASLLTEMRKFETGLRPLEKVADIVVETKIDELHQGFNASNGLMTPTFKPRPANLVAHYRDRLDGLYAKH